MTVKDFQLFFYDELIEYYPKQEIASFFFMLLEKRMNLNRVKLALNPDIKLDKENLSYLNTALKRLKNQEPIQYILGETSFLDYIFKVDKNVLIPRPETEELVLWVSENNQLSNPKILDIGTGSGCIAVSISKKIPNAAVTAIDKSKDALRIAHQNAEINDALIDFEEMDVLECKDFNKKFDIIISNPPYVKLEEKKLMKNNVLENEPHLALFVKNQDPLIFYEKISELALKSLNTNGFLYFEINEQYGHEMINLLKDKNFKNIELKKDLFGKDRMIKAQID